MRPEPPPNVTLGPMAPHIPADIYRQAGGRPFVIVQAAPTPTHSARSYAGPVAVGLGIALALMGFVAAALALFEFALRTAAVVGSLTGPIGVGLGLKIFHPKSK
ncbi:hypothetical protein [Streptomyces sp. ISL-11]|uniref:hypothetical protein n=1 Tax=Streptomyces sp. ISL-11 TaxID=2819174 RepID=UPI001BEC001A|nr:hypothetical protein [Streptomyces sp. ISL-11]MBT2383103.1 hypothetical protein [Streptomyces sp. ISL-11]